MFESGRSIARIRLAVTSAERRMLKSATQVGHGRRCWMSLPLRSRPTLAATTALLLGLALGCGPADRRAQVVYYYQAGSEAAARQMPALRALETEFPGKVVVKIIDASPPEAQKDVTRLGLSRP